MMAGGLILIYGWESYDFSTLGPSYCCSGGDLCEENKKS